MCCAGCMGMSTAYLKEGETVDKDEVRIVSEAPLTQNPVCWMAGTTQPAAALSACHLLCSMLHLQSSWLSACCRREHFPSQIHACTAR